MEFRFVVTAAVLLFVVALCLYVSLRPSGPGDGE